MSELRQLLLGIDTDQVKASITASIDQKDLYNQLCEFLAECETKNVELFSPIRDLIVDFIVEFGVLYANQNESENQTFEPEKRRQFLLEILRKYSQFTFDNEAEKIEFLKLVARTIIPLEFSDPSNKEKYAQIRFVICIFVAVKTNNPNKNFKYIDNYFQLIIHQKFVYKILHVLLNALETYDFSAAEWTELQKVYKSAKMYYVLLKAWNYFQLNENHGFQNKDAERALQIIGECMYAMEKLKHRTFEDYMNVFHAAYSLRYVVVGIRDKVSHFLQDQVKFESLLDNVEMFLPKKYIKLGVFIYEMIKCTRKEIETMAIKEFQDLLKQDKITELLDRVSEIQILDKDVPSPTLPLMSIGTEISTSLREARYFMENFKKQKLGDGINNENLKKNFDALESYLQSPKTELTRELNIFNFAKWLKVENEPSKERIEKKLAAIPIAPKPYADSLGFNQFLITFDELVTHLPDCQPKFKLKYLHNTLTDNIYSSEVVRDYSNEFIVVDSFLEKIENSIINPDDQLKFKNLSNDLITKRDLYYEYIILKDFESIKRRWPKEKNSSKPLSESALKNYRDPLKTIMTNIEFNWPDYKVVENFLSLIKWKNKEDIVEKIRENSFKNLENNLLQNLHFQSKDNENVYEMIYINSLEILKKMEIKICQDFNFADFEGTIPICQNLRNFLAHGDIYLDLFFEDTIQAIKSHIRLFTEHYQNIKSLGYPRSDDFEKVKADFEKRIRWTEESSKILNWNFEDKVLEHYLSDSMTFKIKDYQGRSIIHYNLKQINNETPFLMYLITKVSDPNFEMNELFERMIEDSKINNYYPEEFVDLSENNSLDIFIDQLIHAKDIEGIQFNLACIICASSNDYELLKKVQLEESLFAFGPLQIAVANNQIDLVKKMLEEQVVLDNIDGEYFGWTALEHAVRTNNEELFSLLIEKGANPNMHLVNGRGKSTRMSISNLTHIFMDSHSPVCLAAANNNPDMIQLLINHGASFENHINYSPILTNVCFNTDPIIVKSFCQDNPQLLNYEIMPDVKILHTACVLGRLDMVKVLIEEIIPKNDWEELYKKHILGFASVESGTVELMEYLIGKGALVTCDCGCQNFLIRASTSNKLDLMEILVKHGCTLESVKDRIFENALLNQNMEMIEFLLEKGVPMDWAKNPYLYFEFGLKKNPPIEWIRASTPHIINGRSKQRIELLIKYSKTNQIPLPITLLQMAVANGTWKYLKLLSDCHEIEHDELEASKMLLESVKTVNIPMAEIALKKGANIAYKEHYESLLEMSCKLANEHRSGLKMTKWLLDNGADVNCFVKYRGTPLDLAIDSSNDQITKVMELLSEKGGSSKYGIDFFNLTPENCLLYGVVANNVNLIEKAITDGADINFNFKQFQNGTVLHVCCNFEVPVKLTTLKRLLDLGPDASITDDSGCTALDLALIYKMCPVIKILRDSQGLQHYNLDYESLHPNQLLVSSIFRKDLNMAHDALVKGADVNWHIDDFNRNTPLHIACKWRVFEIARFFLENGAHPLTPCYDNYSPLSYAIGSNDYELVVLLLSRVEDLSKNDKNDLLELAAVGNYVNSARALLEIGADINFEFKSQGHKSIPYIACLLPFNKGKEMMKLFLNHGRPNLELLHLLHFEAQQMNNKEVADVIWTHIDSQNMKTAAKGLFESIPELVPSHQLLMGVFMDSTDLVQAALDRGADINELIGGESITTVLHEASRAGSVELIQFLLDKGANPNVLNFKSLTPLDVAKVFENDRVVSLLSKHTSSNSNN